MDLHISIIKFDYTTNILSLFLNIQDTLFYPGLTYDTVFWMKKTSYEINVNTNNQLTNLLTKKTACFVLPSLHSTE